MCFPAQFSRSWLQQHVFLFTFLLVHEQDCCALWLANTTTFVWLLRNYKLQVPLCVSLHDISVQGFQYIRYTSYPRLTWLGSIGRTRLRRLENWHSNTRFQVFTCSRTNWGLEVLLLKRLRGKPEHREKTSLSKEETNKNADPTRRRHWDLNPDHTGGGRVLSPLRHYCSPTPYSHQLLSHFLQRDFYAG